MQESVATLAYYDSHGVCIWPRCFISCEVRKRMYNPQHEKAVGDRVRLSLILFSLVKMPGFEMHAATRGVVNQESRKRMGSGSDKKH